MGNKKWSVKRITVNLSQVEITKLQTACQATGRAQTDLIREQIRSLATLQFETEQDANQWAVNSYVAQKWVSNRITINLTREESAVLERFCSSNKLSITTTVRGLLSGL